MSFTSNTIVYSRQNGNLPSPESVMKDLLDDGDIPIRLITDKNSESFKEVQEYCPEIEIEYIIVVVNYFTVFNA